MDYPVLNKAPDIANAVVPHSVDANGNAVPQANATRVAGVNGGAVTQSSAYSSGNAVGTLWTFSGCPSGGVLQGVILRDKAGNNVSYDLALFDSAPAAPTDKSAVSVSTTDVAKCIGTVSLSGLVSLGTPGVISADGLGKAFRLGSAATTITAILVTRGTPTFNSTTDVSIDLIFI